MRREEQRRGRCCCVRSGAGKPGQQRHVVDDDRRPDIGLEVREAAPGAAIQAEGSLQARDYLGFDAGAEVAQLAIDPVAPDHVFDREPSLLRECHIPLRPPLAGRHGLASKNAALGLVDQACNQRQIMPDLAGSRRSSQSSRSGPDLAALVEAGDGGIGRRDQVPIEFGPCASRRGNAGSHERASWPSGDDCARRSARRQVRCCGMRCG